jgi:hypothetical protein
VKSVSRCLYERAEEKYGNIRAVGVQAELRTGDLPIETHKRYSLGHCARVLGAFAKLREATITFVMSVRPHGITRLPLDGFS